METQEKIKLLAYHLRTKRVCGLNKEDNTPKIENILVKLTGLTSLKKQCKSLAVSGYIKDSPPKIEAVLERNEKTLEWKSLGEKEINEAQKEVDKLLITSKVQGKIDYKAAFETQKAKNDDLERRLKALEIKPKPGPKVKPQKPQDNE